MVNKEIRNVETGSSIRLRALKLLQWLTSQVRSGVRKLSAGWPDLLSVTFTFVALAIAVYSVDRAKWTYPQPSLVLVLFLAVLTTLAVVRSPIPVWAKHASILLAGVGATVWQLASLPLFLPWWWEMTRAPNQTTIHFTTLMLFATWTVGYLSTWSLLRWRNAWMAITLGAIVTVANLSNLPKNNYYFFALYVLAAILLLGQVNLAREQKDLSRQGNRFLVHGALYYAGVVVVTGILAASAALVIPEIRLSHIGSAIASKSPLKDAEKMWLNVFAAVPGKWDILRSEKEEQLFFSDPPSQSEAIQFVVSSHNSDYWRTRRYHTYFPWGWTGNSTIDNMFYPGKDVSASESVQGQEITYSVTNKLKTDRLLTTGEFRTSNLPVKLQTFEHQSPLAPAEPIKDVISVTAPRLLQPEEPYSMTVSVIKATPAQLSRLDMGFDPWFTAHYLQLPDTLPDRVRRLSRTVTRGSRTQYEKVIAVKEYLQGLRYSRQLIGAPDGADGVDFFLFESRQGDCFQFASATAVMLRAVGVPARISAGYRLTEQNKNSTEFILRARDYHARAEVYFPGYGWVEFETTPGLSPAEDIVLPGRGGSAENNPDELEFMGGTEGSSLTAARDESSFPLWKRNAYFSATLAFLSVMLTLAAAAYVLYQRWLAQLQLTGDAAYIYAKMCSLASRSKVGPNPAETPLEYGGRLASTLSEESQSIDSITRSYTETRFSMKKDLDEAHRVRLEKSWIQLYPTLVRRLLPFKRR